MFYLQRLWLMAVLGRFNLNDAVLLPGTYGHVQGIAFHTRSSADNAPHLCGKRFKFLAVVSSAKNLDLRIFVHTFVIRTEICQSSIIGPFKHSKRHTIAPNP